MLLQGVFEKLRSFDAYPKTLDDFRIKTFGGGTGREHHEKFGVGPSRPLTIQAPYIIYR